MKIAVYSCHSYEREYLEKANTDRHELIFTDEELSSESVELAENCKVISIFSSDTIDVNIAQKLKDIGVQLIATRSAGTDHIDLDAAENNDLQVTNVPEYSPNAIAEHCIALTLALNRNLKSSFHRIENYNFSLEGLVGHEIRSKTVGICGTGDIGQVVAELFHAFGAKVLLFDAEESDALAENDWCQYVDKEKLLAESDIISLNLPLNKDTSHFISAAELDSMKDSAFLINTGRGALVDTEQVRNALRDKKIAGFAMDVYENEQGIFQHDLSDKADKDELLASLIDMENVIVTGHQAFLTDTALRNMMETVFKNISEFEKGNVLNLVTA